MPRPTAQSIASFCAVTSKGVLPLAASFWIKPKEGACFLYKVAMARQKTYDWKNLPKPFCL